MLVAVAYLAFLITLWGFTSLLTDTDPIVETDAGPLLGPAMAVAAGIVVARALWRLRRHRSVALIAIGTTAVVYLAMLGVGAIGYYITTATPVELLLFIARYALSPYIVGAALLGGVAVLFLWVVTVRDRRSAASDDHLTGPVSGD